MSNKIKIYIGSTTALILLFIIGVKVYKNSQEEKYSFLAQEDAAVFIRPYAPKYGNENAKVFLIEFLDPECETCRVFYPKVKELLAKYKDKVQLVVRYAPFHHNSILAVRALEAARKQGKYWEGLETLFKNQPSWGDHHNPKPALIFEYLSKLGLDMNKLEADIKDPQIEKNIKQDIEDLKRLNVRKTPSFFVNGRPLKFFGYENLVKLVEEEIEKAYK
jgi:protein-disulfide isomerase